MKIGAQSLTILGKRVSMTENLARASDGMWEEALNFLEFFVYFFCQEKK